MNEVDLSFWHNYVLGVQYYLWFLKLFTNKSDEAWDQEIDGSILHKEVVPIINENVTFLPWNFL